MPGRTSPQPRRTEGAGGPERTCIGCRRHGWRSALVRFVAVEVAGGHQVVHDPGACLPGRGAWLHPDPGCAELAVRRKAFARALRVTGPLDTGSVLPAVTTVAGHEAAAGADEDR